MLFGTQGLESLKCTTRASVCINYYVLFGMQGLDSLKCTTRASVVYKLLYVIWNTGIRFIEVYHSSKCGV